MFTKSSGLEISAAEISERADYYISIANKNPLEYGNEIDIGKMYREGVTAAYCLINQPKTARKAHYARLNPDAYIADEAIFELAQDRCVILEQDAEYYVSLDDLRRLAQY